MIKNGFGLLIVLSGPSGVGKGTVCKRLLEANENITYSVSATTRPRRPGEVEGSHYFFMQENEFLQMARNKEFLEYTRVFGEYSYGTPRKYVMDQLQAGRDVILEIDVQGGLQVKETYPDAVLIFVAPPSMDELKRRLVDRGTEDPESIRLRTETAYGEMQCISFYDYVVINDAVENALVGIEAIVHAEKSRVTRREDIVSLLLEGDGNNDDELSWS
ncbi:guanylate kinase [Christensenellaceae bacterium OttesenSCG-928-L17]|nr:guanylate kinase [Christensenellaceae bacterium OttesenSCG-928-L17]